MELMFAWFWLVKLVIFLAFFGTALMAIRSKFKNWLWNILAIGFVLFYIMLPVKMVPKTDQVNNQINYEIQQRKSVELPPMVKDDSFKKAADKVTNDSSMDQEIK